MLNSPDEKQANPSNKNKLEISNDNHIDASVDKPSNNKINADSENKKANINNEGSLDNQRARRKQKLIELFDRIKTNLQNLPTAKIHPSFLKYISVKQFQEIYQYFIKHETEIISHILNSTFTPEQDAYRLDKSSFKIFRTCNIVYDPIFKKYALFLETKSKLSNNFMVSVPKFGGGFKHGKPTVRLDSPLLEVWANMVVKNSSNEVAKAVKEAALSHRLYYYAVKHPTYFNTTEETLPLHIPINYSICGAIFSTQDPKLQKVSLYSYFASLGNLRDAWKSRADFSTNLKRCIFDLLYAVKIMHDNNIIHQDIKPDNVLVFENNNTSVGFKLTDFGISSDEENAPFHGGTRGYESPEISASYLSPQSRHHQSFHGEKPSFARDVLKLDPELTAHILKQNYKFAHKANDMWALGVTLYEMLAKGARIAEEDSTIRSQAIAGNPLLAKLLAFTRENRCTIDEAIKIFKADPDACITIKRPDHLTNKKNVGQQAMCKESILPQPVFAQPSAQILRLEKPKEVNVSKEKPSESLNNCKNADPRISQSCLDQIELLRKEESLRRRLAALQYPHLLKKEQQRQQLQQESLKSIDKASMPASAVPAPAMEILPVEASNPLKTPPAEQGTRLPALTQVLKKLQEMPIPEKLQSTVVMYLNELCNVINQSAYDPFSQALGNVALPVAKSQSPLPASIPAAPSRSMQIPRDGNQLVVSVKGKNSPDVVFLYETKSKQLSDKEKQSNQNDLPAKSKGLNQLR